MTDVLISCAEVIITLSRTMIAAQLVKISITKKTALLIKKLHSPKMMKLNIQPTETQTLLKVGVEGWRLGDGGWGIGDRGWLMGDRGWGMGDGGWGMGDGGWGMGNGLMSHPHKKYHY